MIGNSKWFTQRKYTGWGLTPKTWQGWVYILAFITPLIIINSFLVLNETIKTYITVAWTAILLIDVLDMMRKLKLDEREIAHEALAERNAMWFMVFSLAVGLVIEAVITGTQGNLHIDPVILVALFGSVIIKAITHFYLRNK